MAAFLKEDFKRLIPLIGVLSVVFVSTAVVSLIRSEYAFMEVGKTLMAMFFLTFGGFKLYNLDGFVEAFKSYDLLAERSDFYAKLYPFFEVGLGLLFASLLYTSSFSLQVFTYSATFVLMTVGGLGVLNALREGRDLKCACLGNVFNVPMTKVTLAEDLGMATLSIIMLASVI